MGIKNFLFQRWRSHVDWKFDRQFAVDTSGTFEVSNAPADAIPYAGTPPYRFYSIMSKLSFEPRELTFVDFGCGKGRVLLMASQFGFKRVIGIEHSPELSDIAKSNVAIYQRARGRPSDIRVNCENAADFRIPPGKTLLYFYNPFMGNVMGAVLANIQQALKETFREITIVYYNPVYGHLFDAADFLDCVKKGRQYSVYRSITKPRD